MKKKSFTLHLKKTNIVNLTLMRQLVGGTNPSEDTINNDTCNGNTCVVSECHNTVTKDRPNTNNTVPTLSNATANPNTTTQTQPPQLPTLSCVPCNG